MFCSTSALPTAGHAVENREIIEHGTVNYGKSSVKLLMLYAPSHVLRRESVSVIGIIISALSFNLMVLI